MDTVHGLLSLSDESSSTKTELSNKAIMWCVQTEETKAKILLRVGNRTAQLHIQLSTDRCRIQSHWTQRKRQTQCDSSVIIMLMKTQSLLLKSHQSTRCQMTERFLNCQLHLCVSCGLWIYWNATENPKNATQRKTESIEWWRKNNAKSDTSI